VQTEFAARYEFEMLDRIGDVDLLPVDAGLLERPVEHLARRADERLAGEIFLVAGLLADQHDRGGGRSFAEHGLGGVLPQRTGAAGAGFVAQHAEAVAGHLTLPSSIIGFAGPLPDSIGGGLVWFHRSHWFS
jgi:hypothetical protein